MSENVPYRLDYLYLVNMLFGFSFTSLVFIGDTDLFPHPTSNSKRWAELGKNLYT